LICGDKDSDGVDERIGEIVKRSMEMQGGAVAFVKTPTGDRVPQNISPMQQQTQGPLQSRGEMHQPQESEQAQKKSLVLQKQKPTPQKPTPPSRRQTQPGNNTPPLMSCRTFGRPFPHTNRPPKDPTKHRYDDDTATSSANRYANREEELMRQKIASSSRFCKSLVENFVNKKVVRAHYSASNSAPPLSPRLIEARSPPKKKQDLHDKVRKDRRNMLKKNKILRMKQQEQLKQRIDLRKRREKKEIRLKLESFASNLIQRVWRGREERKKFKSRLQQVSKQFFWCTACPCGPPK